MIDSLVYADFQNADANGRLRLNCDGTLRDLTRQKIQLRAGMTLSLYSDDSADDGTLDELRATGVVEFSAEEQIWVATIDWSAISHASANRSEPSRGGATRLETLVDCFYVC